MISSAETTLATHGAGGRKNERWVVDALKAHKAAVKGASVLIYGSMEPWYEAMMLAAGAASVTTVEYNQLTYDHPSITTVTPPELKTATPSGGFDVALSISSFDHDGLGRYGDPLEPDNDLRAMRVASCLLKTDGLFLFTAPIGPDAVVWNLHRRYGKARLPWMLDDWSVLDVVGWDEDRLTAEIDWRRTYEPVFVLARGCWTTGGCALHTLRRACANGTFDCRCLRQVQGWRVAPEGDGPAAPRALRRWLGWGLAWGLVCGGG